MSQRGDRFLRLAVQYDQRAAVRAQRCVEFQQACVNKLDAAVLA